MCLIFCAIQLLTPKTQAKEICIFAAASLSDALNEIVNSYEKIHPDKIILNLEASSILARQIQAGAPADLFISADEAKMDLLQKSGLIITESRKSLLSNALVFVTASDNDLVLKDPTKLIDSNIKHIGIAEPQSVPAGIYAREYLQQKGAWDKIYPRVIPMENVRAVLAAVASNNVDLGVVYKTDAAITKKVKIIYTVPVNEGPKISYPVAIIANTKQLEVARQFYSYLTSADSLKVFERYGFLIQH
jgi:molybdate transport system substrate-binding protein